METKVYKNMYSCRSFCSIYCILSLPCEPCAALNITFKLFQCDALAEHFGSQLSECEIKLKFEIRNSESSDLKRRNL